MSLRFDSTEALAAALDMLNAYYKFVRDDVLVQRASGGAPPSPRALSSDVGDVRPEVFFPPALRVRYDECSSRLDILRAALRRSCALRGVDSIPRIQSTIDASVSSGEPIARLELAGANLDEDAVAARSLTEALVAALDYQNAPDEPLLDNLPVSRVSLFSSRSLTSIARQIRELIVSRCAIGPDTARQLGAAIYAARATLRSLTLERCELGADGARLLLPFIVDHKKIAALSLDGNAIGVTALSEMARALAGCKQLVALSLASNALNERATRPLASMIAVRDNWTRLELGGNAFGDAGVATLVKQAFESGSGLPRLDTLDLSATGFVFSVSVFVSSRLVPAVMTSAPSQHDASERGAVGQVGDEAAPAEATRAARQRAQLGQARRAHARAVRDEPHRSARDAALDQVAARAADALRRRRASRRTPAALARQCHVISDARLWRCARRQGRCRAARRRRRSRLVAGRTSLLPRHHLALLTSCSPPARSGAGVGWQHVEIGLFLGASLVV